MRTDRLRAVGVLQGTREQNEPPGWRAGIGGPDACLLGSDDAGLSFVDREPAVRLAHLRHVVHEHRAGSACGVRIGVLVVVEAGVTQGAQLRGAPSDPGARLDRGADRLVGGTPGGRGFPARAAARARSRGARGRPRRPTAGGGAARRGGWRHRRAVRPAPRPARPGPSPGTRKNRETRLTVVSRLGLELAGALEVAETGEEGLDLEVAERSGIGSLVGAPGQLGGKQPEGADHRTHRGLHRAQRLGSPGLRRLAQPGLGDGTGRRPTGVPRAGPAAGEGELPRRAEQAQPVPVRREEVEALLGACRSRRNRFLLVLLWLCGLRVGDALGLHHCDLHFASSVAALGCAMSGPHLHVAGRDNANGARAIRRRAVRHGSPVCLPDRAAKAFAGGGGIVFKFTDANWLGPSAQSCRREAARRAPKVLRRSGRTRTADSCGRSAPAGMATQHVIRLLCWVALSRGRAVGRAARSRAVKTYREFSQHGRVAPARPLRPSVSASCASATRGRTTRPAGWPRGSSPARRARAPSCSEGT